jgi:adenylylsulfate kinase-like enzyme
MSTEKRPQLTEAEVLFMHYKKGMAGSGMTALIEAIWKLDRKNRAKIYNLDGNKQMSTSM